MIISMMMTVIVPRMMKRPSETEWPVVVDMINDLVTLARQEAMTYQVIHRITIDIKGEEQVIRVEREEKDPENAAKKIYAPVSSLYMKTEYILPETIKVRGVFWGKEEQLEQNKGQAACYIMTDGLVQQVMIHLARLDEFEEQEDIISLELNPFYGQFSYTEGLKKPGLVS